ncbi:hypothetical protein ACJJTC_010438 [Scirpophaga incertulas]
MARTAARSGEATRAFASGEARLDRPRICLARLPREAARSGGWCATCARCDIKLNNTVFHPGVIAFPIFVSPGEQKGNRRDIPRLEFLVFSINLRPIGLLEKIPKGRLTGQMEGRSFERVDCCRKMPNTDCDLVHLKVPFSDWNVEVSLGYIYLSHEVAFLKKF